MGLQWLETPEQLLMLKTEELLYILSMHPFSGEMPNPIIHRIRILKVVA